MWRSACARHIHAESGLTVQLNHLHLHVRDRALARAFYERWFGFREHVTHGDILFLRDAGGFDLALAPDEVSVTLPGWFHFGFRRETADDVRRLRSEMESAGVAMATELYAFDDHVSFRCKDPDGYAIEIYWDA